MIRKRIGAIVGNVVGAGIAVVLVGGVASSFVPHDPIAGHRDAPTPYVPPAQTHGPSVISEIVTNTVPPPVLYVAPRIIQPYDLSKKPVDNTQLTHDSQGNPLPSGADVAAWARERLASGGAFSSNLNSAAHKTTSTHKTSDGSPITGGAGSGVSDISGQTNIPYAHNAFPSGTAIDGSTITGSTDINASWIDKIN